MNESLAARVDALFDEVLALPDGERSAHLDARCGDDPALRAAVEELLRLTNEPVPVLGVGVLAASLLRGTATLPVPGSGLEPGQRVGAWRVQRELGRGGMGAVYLVERADGQFEQRAALKLVGAPLESEDIARRFERERRILALLAHANIARLLDGGQTDDGRPYFVMEYVEGRSIDRFCDEERLTIDERLDLFVRVCRAVQHAHRQLVVHRDIKPSNIFVTAEREVKLLDFGIAGLLSTTGGRLDDGLTQAISRRLTPEYASPEQLRDGPVAIASDVYQLGLLLYEILTGCRAQVVTEHGVEALARAVCESVPPRPSDRVEGASPEICASRGARSAAALARTLRGDLDTIVLYALRKEPERRYQSVGDLIEDVERCRKGLPVRAQPDSLRYRARRFAGRHRIGMAWAAALVLVAAIAVPVVANQRWRAAREAARAEHVERILAGLIAFPNPRVAGHPPTTVHYLDHAAGLIRTELVGQPVSQARLLTQLGRLYNALGQYEASIDVLGEALALRRARFGRDSVEVAETLEWLGQSQHYVGRYAQAEASVRQALAIRRRRSGPDDPDAIRTAIELGDLLHTQGKLVEAERTLRPVVASLKASVVTRRAEDLGHDSLPRSLRDLGNVLRDRGLLDESAALYREAIAIFRGQPVAWPAPLELRKEVGQQLATSETYFARLLIMQSDFEAAEGMLAEAIPALRRIYAGDHPLVGMAFREYGYLRIEQGRYDEAEGFLAEAQRIQLELLGPDHSSVPRARAHQAELARRRGRLTAAVTLARQTLGEFERLSIADHPSAIDARLTLAEALLSQGQARLAASELRRALAVAERQFIRGDRRTERIRRALARARGTRAPAISASP